MKTLAEALNARDAVYALEKRLRSTDEFLEDVRVAVGNFRLPHDGGLFMRVEVVHLIPVNPWHAAADINAAPSASPAARDA